MLPVCVHSSLTGYYGPPQPMCIWAFGMYLRAEEILTISHDLAGGKHAVASGLAASLYLWSRWWSAPTCIPI